ncbi:MAG TPA: NPCBM/NEW2 domain-containing protein [Roseiflexaceae bacterium]|nr:NPCBM/NEW2 domain-containing protein [Roseiflexaceae bacterium]
MRGSRFRYGVMLLMLLALVVPAASKAPRASADGPGFGNLFYSEQELFAPIARVDTATGVPANGDGKPFGLNVGMMHNGYFATVFAPDSGDGPGGLLFYDISDPRRLRLVNRVYEPEGRTGELREAHAIGASNSYPGSYVVLQSGKGIEFWDWTDVARPVQLSRMRLPGVEFGDYGSVAWQLFWQAPFVYVAVAEQGIYIVDATDPRHPVLVDRGGGRPNPIPPSQLGGFSVGPIFAIGNLLVISGMETENSLATLDISDPRNPRLLASLGEGVPLYYASSFNGGRIITSQRGGGARMHVFDVSDPSRIALVNDGLEIDDQLYNATQDHYVFQGAQDEVVKVDISNPQDYRIVGRGSLGVPKPDHGQVTPVGNLLFVGNDHGTGSGFIVHQAAPDQSAPRVNMVSPADGATGQPLTSRIGISLSDMIDLRSVTAESFIVRPLGGAPLAGKYSHQTAIVNFFPDQPLLPNTTYEVLVPAGGLRDWAGNPTDQAFSSRFSTGAAVSSLRVKLAAATPQVAGAPASFSASVSGASPASPVEFSWVFGDGTSATPFSASPTVAHSYSAAGHYSVSVTVRNGAQLAGDSMTQIIHNPLTPGKPTSASTVIYGGDKVWAVNPDNDSITALDAGTYTRLFEQPAGDNPRTLAQASDGTVWVVNQDSATVTLHRPADGAPVHTIGLPRGSAPYGIAFNPAGDTAFVSLQGIGALLKIDRASGTVTGQTALPGPARGVAVSHNGARVYVSRFLSSASRGEVYEIDPATMALVQTIPLAYDKTPDGENRGRGLPNYLSALAINPDGTRLWVPSKKDNTARGQLRDGSPLTFESTVRTIASQIDISSGSEVALRRIDFNDRDMAQAVAFSPLGNYAYVALQGSNMVQVHDAYVGARVAILFDTGLAPQGLALSPDGDRLFVHNLMSRTVRVYDVSGINQAREYAARPLATVTTVAEERLPPDLLLGKQLFYNARDRRMSRDGYLACASCHLDGGGDGQVWDFTDRGEGLRNTPSLRGPGVREGNLHWTGNFDEIQDFESDIRNAFGGTGFLSDADFAAGTRNPLGHPKAGLSRELDALAAYVRSLAAVGPSPHRAPDGALTADAQAGRLLFKQRGCVACHAGPGFTDSRTGMLHNVGTLKPSSGQRAGQPLAGLDTPALSGLWASAPFLHDGSAATLLDVLTAANPAGLHGDLAGLDDAQRQQLVAYLLQIDDAEAATPPSSLFAARLTGGQVTPAVATTAAGRASVVLLDDGTNALVTLRLEGLADPVTAVTLHGPAGPGMEAPALLRLPDGPLSAQPITLTLQQAEHLRAGQLYLRVATARRPDGALRGQIGASAAVPTGTSYLSDLTWESMRNGWGPVERDQANGSNAAADGQPITLDGVPYAKGLGVRAASEVVYRLGGTCSRLLSDAGLDDIVGGGGSVAFQIWADGRLVYDSGPTTGSDPPRRIDLAIGGVDELRLLVTDGGDGNNNDYAIWADARVSCPTWHLSLPTITR